MQNIFNHTQFESIVLVQTVWIRLMNNEMPLTYCEDGLYGADAVVSRAPVSTVVVEAFLQDVLVT